MDIDKELERIKNQLASVLTALGALEAKLAQARGELEALDDRRRQIIALRR